MSLFVRPSRRPPAASAVRPPETSAPSRGEGRVGRLLLSAPTVGSSGQRRRRGWVAAGTLLVVLLVLEGGLRLYAGVAHRERGVVFDPACGWHMRAGLTKVGPQWSAARPATTNAAGWRDEEWAAAPAPGTQRIAVLGDSYTFGIGVDHGERFTEYLEELCPGVEVLNFGCNAYGTDQELVTLEREVVAYRPEIVVLAAFPANDLRDITLDRNGHWPKPHFRLDGEELVHVPARATRDVRLRTSSYVGEGVFRLVQGCLAGSRPVERPDEPLALFGALVRRMAEVARGNGARFLVLVIHPSGDLNEAAGLGTRRALLLLAVAEIPLLDTFAAFSAARSAGEALYLPRHDHWSAAGHRRAAALLADRLRAEAWVKDD